MSGHQGAARFVFLDLEASSLLPGAFPLEIGWVEEDGAGESYLIRPAPEWLASEVGWDAVSAAVHGISRETLAAEGQSPVEVASRAVQVLAAPGVIVYSDAPEWDGQWLRLLLDAASRPECVVVQDVREAYAAACRPLLGAVPRREGSARDRLRQHVHALARMTIKRAQEAEAERSRVRHRALPDAYGIWRVWRAVSAEVRSVLIERTGAPLFRAAYRGETHTVGQASPDELGLLAGQLADGPARDTLTSWTLVSVRWPNSRRSDVHALGWRVDEHVVWITSQVRVFDPHEFKVQTRSGAVYRLGAPDGQTIGAHFLAHLSYALRVWGYTDISA